MNVVITGSTKGIGKALAYKFLSEGDKIIITSRNKERVESTVSEFSSEFSEEKVFGIACDVSDATHVDSLIQFALKKLDQIDIWINNAGTNGFDWNHLVDMKVSSIRTVIETNIIGTILCCRAILKVMIKQGSGNIFNFEGMGSSGNTRARMLCYTTTKYAVPMIMKTLLMETQGLNVGIHDISPGMVRTDLLLKGRDPQTREFVDRFAQNPEVVADFLVPQIRTVEGTGKTIRFIRPNQS